MTWESYGGHFIQINWAIPHLGRAIDLFMVSIYELAIFKFKAGCIAGLSSN